MKRFVLFVFVVAVLLNSSTAAATCANCYHSVTLWVENKTDTDIQIKTAGFQNYAQFHTAFYNWAYNHDVKWAKEYFTAEQSVADPADFIISSVTDNMSVDAHSLFNMELDEAVSCETTLAPDEGHGCRWSNDIWGDDGVYVLVAVTDIATGRGCAFFLLEDIMCHADNYILTLDPNVTREGAGRVSNVYYNGTIDNSRKAGASINVTACQ